MAAQEELAARQEAQQEKLGLLREQQEEEFAVNRQALEEELANQRELSEQQIAQERRTLEDELALRRQEIEEGIRIDRAAFAAEQRQLDISAAQQVAAILNNARPQTLTARRHGGPVGPEGAYLVGEAPHLGPELGVFSGKPFLFTQPTILSSPPQGRIYSPEQTKRIMRASPPAVASGHSSREVEIADEIRQLRQQVGRIREVMPLLEALSQNLATDTGQLAKDQSFERARDRLRRF